MVRSTVAGVDEDRMLADPVVAFADGAFALSFTPCCGVGVVEVRGALARRGKAHRSRGCARLARFVPTSSAHGSARLRRFVAAVAAAGRLGRPAEWVEGAAEQLADDGMLTAAASAGQ